MLTRLVFSLACCLCSLAAQGDETAMVDRLLAAQCAQCHGTDGEPVDTVEDLAGKDLASLYQELLEMKAEDHPEGIMDHQALGYTDAQLYRIARYFDSLEAEHE